MWSAYDPPLLAPLPWLGRARWLGTGLHRLILRALLRVSRRWAKPIFALRVAKGLPEGPDPFCEGAFSSPLTLCLWPKELGAPQPDWPSAARTTGFVDYDPQTPKGLDPALESFLTAGEPPVVFALGSTAVERLERSVETFIEAAAQCGQRAVLTAGRHRARWSELESESIFIANYAPYDLLFGRCALIVHQGGVGTTGKALSARRPMIVLPSCNDQYDNAERCRRLGVADVLPLAQLSAKRLSQRILALLDDAKVLERCQNTSEAIAHQRGAQHAADLLEREVLTCAS